MDKHTITLEELNLLLDRKYFFTKERFINYFNSLGIGMENEDIENCWHIWESFPRYKLESIDNVAFIIERLLAYPNLGLSFDYDAHRIFYKSSNKNRHKIYYKKQNEIVSFEVDFHSPDDIALYAEFLKRNIENVIVAVDYVEEIYHKNKTIYVYSGDTFSTRDKWWDRKRDGKLFVCTQDGFRQLLYTEGKGYLRNGEPDYDDSHYSSHVVTGHDGFKYIGNIYADSSFLVDQIKTNEKDAK